ncbi:hypothetical protein ACFPOA_14555 [Lysobacter niabensis]|uniref:hypothetical protein n=1 Tax=Agrilutibacter niabensis TaxID=380628 RepID=UPI00361D3AD2
MKLPVRHARHRMKRAARDRVDMSVASAVVTDLFFFVCLASTGIRQCPRMMAQSAKQKPLTPVAGTRRARA